MRTLNTLGLLLIVAGLAAFIFWKERYAPSSAEIVDLNQRTLTFEIDAVTGLDIEMPGAAYQLTRLSAPKKASSKLGLPNAASMSNAPDQATAKETPGSWVLGDPEGERANPELCDALIEALSKLTISEAITVDEIDTVDSDNFGFAEGTTVLTLELKGSPTPFQIEVGGEGAIDGSTYVRPLNGRRSGEIHLVRQDLRNLLASSPTGFRDPSIFRLGSEDIVGLLVSEGSKTGDRGKREMEFSRLSSEHYWMLSRPLQTRADDEGVEALLSQFLGLTASGIVREMTAEGPPPGASPDIEASIVTIPKREAAPTADTAARATTVRLWRPTAEGAPALATLSDRPGMFTVPAAMMPLMASSPDELRDRQLARIEPSLVGAISISGRAFTDIPLAKQQDRWVLQRNGKAEFANPARIDALFSALNGHEIREFVTDSASNLSAYGLESPLMEIALTAADVPGGNPSDAASTILRLGGGSDGTLYANYAGEPFVYEVGPEILGEIPSQAIKWRGTSIIRFTIFELRSISVSRGLAPPVTVRYEVTTNNWTAESSGVDLTPRLERTAAELLGARLSTLRARDWLADRAEAFARLRDPLLQVEIELGAYGTEPTTRTLSFVPQGDPKTARYFLGTITGDPEVFIIGREQFEWINASVLFPDGEEAE